MLKATDAIFWCFLAKAHKGRKDKIGAEIKKEEGGEVDNERENKILC